MRFRWKHTVARGAGQELLPPLVAVVAASDSAATAAAECGFWESPHTLTDTTPYSVPLWVPVLKAGVTFAPLKVMSARALGEAHMGSVGRAANNG